MVIFLIAFAVLSLYVNGQDPKKLSTDCIRRLLQDGERRPIDGPNAIYENGFEPLFRQQKIRYTPDYFTNLLEERKRNGRSTHVLDLMGSGYFIRKPEIADSTTGMRLFPLKETTPLPEVRNYSVVIGDIFDTQAWQDLKSSMETRKTPALDLTLMQPRNGWQ